MARYQVDDDQRSAWRSRLYCCCSNAPLQWELKRRCLASMLAWSACLHEIGLDISHDGFQRHGAYIAENADMPGFPRAEQRLLAYLIENQRHRVGTRGAEVIAAGLARAGIAPCDSVATGGSVESEVVML